MGAFYQAPFILVAGITFDLLQRVWWYDGKEIRQWSSARCRSGCSTAKPC